MTRWIVVGGGAAGCVIAAALSADESNEVRLLEGGADHGPHPPAGDRGPFLDDPGRIASHMVQRRSGSVREPYLLGAGLGGSSLINGSIVVPDGPGGDGELPIPLEAPARIGAVGAALLAADDRAATVLLTTRDGVRTTVADAVLRPVLHRPNLTVVTRAAVDRLLFDGRRAVGVRTTDGRAHDADRVVLAAGAIGTPVTMLRSGVDTPGVGHHLQDHPAVAVTLRLRTPQTDDLHAITVAITAPDHQVIALERTGPDGIHGALIVGLTNTTSRGSVRLDRHGEQLIALRQLDTSDDRDRMTEAVLDLIGLLDRPALRALADECFVGDRGTRLDELGRDRESVATWMLEHLGGFHHVAGTCRRGEVTDDDGWVRGYDHLAVADASLFVDLPSANVYLSTVLQARELAGRWLGGG